MRRGENTSLCHNWNPTYSSANTSCLDRLTPIFTGHVLGTTCQSNTYFFSLPFTQLFMSSGQNQNLYSTLLMEQYFFNLSYVGTGVPCLLVPTFVLHKVSVLRCMAQHLLVELGGNFAMCQWEEVQSVYNTDVVKINCGKIAFRNSPRFCQFQGINNTQA